MRLLLTCFVLFFAFVSFAQNATPTTTPTDEQLLSLFSSRVQHVLNDHVCEATKETRASIVSWNTFDSLFKPIFSKVMLGNSELVNQGSAVALNVDKFESKFSLNYNWAASKSDGDKGYFNAGFNAVNTSKTFQLYSKNEWQRGVGLQFGYTLPLTKSLFFYPSECQALVAKRKINSVYWLNEVRRLLLVDVTTVQNELQQVEQFYQTHADADEISTGLQHLPYVTKKAYEEAKQNHDKAVHLRTIAASTDSINAYVDALNTKFEQEAY